MEENQKPSDFLPLIGHIPDLNSRHAIEIIGDSEELYKKMLLQFTRRLPAYIDGMDNSLRADEWDIFAIKTHGVKGSLRQIGSLRLASAAESLEMAAKANNPAYCHEHYKDFKDRLLLLYKQVGAAFESLGKRQDKVAGDAGDINDYIETLKRAGTALEDYDSLLAAEILSPIMRMRFGSGTDGLLIKASEAVESFQPQKALEYIEEILRTY